MGMIVPVLAQWQAVFGITICGHPVYIIAQNSLYVFIPFPQVAGPDRASTFDTSAPLHYHPLPRSKQPFSKAQATVK